MSSITNIDLSTIDLDHTDSGDSNTSNEETNGPLLKEVKELNIIFENVINLTTKIAEDTLNYKNGTLTKEEYDEFLTDKISNILEDYKYFENVCDQMHILLLNCIRALECDPKIVDGYMELLNNDNNRNVNKRKGEEEENGIQVKKEKRE
ncbi:hypothetical protein K502DRAFT_341084 [Neoconidiobolus thromboides FSU 785]|nr:hypothetical protein K502DRAFT_341084 [Neoconidiobolus thromboides FSU 785]